MLGRYAIGQSSKVSFGRPTAGVVIDLGYFSPGAVRCAELPVDGRHAGRQVRIGLHLRATRNVIRDLIDPGSSSIRARVVLGFRCHRGEEIEELQFRAACHEVADLCLDAGSVPTGEVSVGIRDAGGWGRQKLLLRVVAQAPGGLLIGVRRDRSRLGAARIGAREDLSRRGDAARESLIDGFARSARRKVDYRGRLVASPVRSCVVDIKLRHTRR